MGEINSLELNGLIANAVRDVFDTMLSMEVESIGNGQTVNFNGGHIVSTVGFAGKVLGNTNLHVNESFAIEMPAAMLGIETDEIDGEEEIHDVLDEL